jgi:5-oxoprolinase (ATP-hydrolysing)
MLYEAVVEAEERVDAAGRVILPLDEERTTADLQRAFDRGISAVAIVLMHGYRHHRHERRIADCQTDRFQPDIGQPPGQSAHQTGGPRRHHTVVDAYLTRCSGAYVDRLAGQLGQTAGAARLMFMQPSGGLTDARLFRGRDAILSGQAGGVVGIVKTAAMSGYRRLIGFDMGGTSTDVSHYDGEYERSFETMVAGVRMRAPMIHIHTVAAGGGSILHFDGCRFRVGPDSAGADPGPACYRRGGPLTVTDCNVLLGRIQVERFPKVFGPGGDEGLDRVQAAV